MEPNFTAGVAPNALQMYGVPFLAFVFGVALSNALKPHGLDRRAHLCLTAAPVAGE